jgi:hypothetical protein
MPNRDLVMRRALQVTAPFNLLAAFALAFPSSWPGRVFGLPVDAPSVYRVLAGGVIAIFGFAYAWLSVQKVIDRELVFVSMSGKIFAFCSLAALAVAGELPLRSAILGSADLLFACVFGWWLLDA